MTKLKTEYNYLDVALVNIFLLEIETKSAKEVLLKKR